MTPRKLVVAIVAVSIASAAVAYAAGTTVTSARITHQTASTTIPPQSVSTTLTLTDATGIDTWIDQDNPATAHTTDTTLHVHPENGNKARRPLLQFDLSSIPSGASVTSALLTMRVTTCPSSNGARTYKLDRPIATWLETVTWGTPRPATTASAAPNVTLAAGCSVGTTLTWTVTGDVQLWFASTANNGWQISDTANGNANDAVQFGSSENATAANRPTLAITYTI